jgi:hypothetical protein
MQDVQQPSCALLTRQSISCSLQYPVLVERDVVLLHIQLHSDQVTLCVRLSTAGNQLASNTDGTIAKVVRAALHLLRVSVEVVAANGDANEEVAVLNVVDVDVPGVLATGNAQCAQDSGIVTPLVGHLGNCQAINHVQVAASTHLIPPAKQTRINWKVGCLTF